MLTDLANILVGIGVACVVLFIPPLLIMAIDWIVRSAIPNFLENYCVWKANKQEAIWNEGYDQGYADGLNVHGRDNGLSN